MSSYYRGNLALEPQEKLKVKVRETRRVVKKRYTIPMAEKLLYLFVVMVCVVVAGIVLWRYAQIYDMNTKIQEIENRIEEIEAENQVMQLEKRELMEPSRLMEIGEEMGFVYVDEGAVEQVQSN